MSRQPSPPHLKLYLLGSFHLQDEKRPILLPVGKAQSLFAYLALHPEEHTREKLAGLYWGDFTDAQARDSLRTLLKKLRKHLDRRVLLADRTTVQLNPAYPLWVDAKEFMISDFRFQIEDQSSFQNQSEIINLKSKIALYRGDLLADFYDDWIAPEREHYRQLYLDALLQFTQAARAASEYERAMQYAQRVLSADPANERAHQHLMFCHLALGDRSAALKQYAACERALQTELAVEPARETTALYRWIQQTPSERAAIAAQITNLPIPLSSFIGRKKELTDLKQFLTTTRLLTLSGAGGSGKTRLAIQVATDLIDYFHDGVWWVDLAPRTADTLVPQAVAQTLGIRNEALTGTLRIQSTMPIDEIESAQLVTESLIHFLREKQLLLVLDNCEHLIAASARLADVLLTHCPNVQIMATSREALGITGERVYQVPTLSLPTQPHLRLADFLIEYEGIRLFVERAGAVKAAFALTEQNGAAVLEICQRLDGIPLALELAAARIKLLSAEEIAARLHDRFNLLTQGSRTALPRHQTLRETIAWSHHLLTGTELILFRRVAVFVGGFTLDAAQAVCADADIQQVQVLDVLSHLVDKSLVIVDEQGLETRYRQLETIREYAREQLDGAGETARLRQQHRDFFIGLAEKAEPKLRGAEQFEWLDRLEVEHDNWRAAWGYAIESDAALALRLASALLEFWLMRGDPREGREWMAKLFERIKAWGETARRAQALNVAGRLAHYQSDFVVARTLLEQSLRIARGLGDKKEIAFALVWLGKTAVYQRDYQIAQSLLEEGFAMYQELQDEWGIATAFQRLAEIAEIRGYSGKEQKEFFLHTLAKYQTLGNRFLAAQVLNALGENARFEEEYESAGIFYEQALEVHRELGRFPTATPLFNLAWVAVHSGDYQKARRLFEESLKLHREYGYKIGMVEECLGGFAAILGMIGKPEAAARLFGAVEALLEKIGRAGGMEQLDQKEYDYYVAAVRAQLNESALAKCWAEGHALTLEQAIEYALEKSKM